MKTFLVPMFAVVTAPNKFAAEQIAERMQVDTNMRLRASDLEGQCNLIIDELLTTTEVAPDVEWGSIKGVVEGTLPERLTTFEATNRTK